MPDSRTKRDLTLGRIVEQASVIVRIEGAEALTMRRLANVCGVTPMALYHHVADKDEVLDKVLNEVIGEILTIELHGSPEERLIELCMATYSVMIDNPGVGRLWSSRGVTVPNMAIVTERFFEILTECGLEGQQVAMALDRIVVYIVGGVAYNLSRAPGVRHELLQNSDARKTPLLDSLIDTYAERDADAQFRHGLDALWRGLKLSPSET